MNDSNKSSLLSEEKKKIRFSCLKKRNSLKISDVLCLSEEVRRKFFVSDLFLNSRSILFYIQYKNELHTETMIRKSIEMGKTVSAPVTLWQDRELYLTRIIDMDREIEVSRSGIPETHRSFLMPIPIRDIDLIIIPGVAFDTQGNRLGYGGGFYDRLLEKKCANTKTLALAYDFQVLDTLPCEAHDMPIDYLISEKREFDFSKSY